MTIFISIAAYRDPELVPTVMDCLAKARHPEALRFGICWQHGEEESSLPFSGDPRFRIIDVDWRASRGACWARAEIMNRYEGEDYFLQLDSHHRFVEHWDEKVLQQLARTGSVKPVLTAYATPFTPGNPGSFENEPMQMNFDRFTPEGIVLFRPGAIPGSVIGQRPVRARFLSAHFLFAAGSFVREVPYDPELYFTGEEITLAVRAYTHGWDFFHPSEIIVWHEYSREYRPHKHWSDHRRENGIVTEWHERDVASKERVRRFLENPAVGKFGCGTVRSFSAYEAYAGLNFKRRRAQRYTEQFLEPPNPPAASTWAERFARYELNIPIARTTLPPRSPEARFWYVGFHDANERELFRQDADETEIRALLDGDGTDILLRRAFESEQEPASWTVWPCVGGEEWLDKIRGQVNVVRPRAATFVTALIDIGRGAPGVPSARSFEEYYLTRFEKVLAIDAPMVVFVEPEREAFVWARRSRADTRVIHVRRADLESLPFYDRVQEIRTRPEWVGQAGWLGESPQALLPHYVPLVFSKMRWLRDTVQQNPFGTENFFWIDAGLSQTVSPQYLSDPALASRLSEASRDLLFVAYPYRGAEVHGFPSDAMTRFGEGRVERVVRGGLFGGRREAIFGLAALYESLLGRTLADGCMGTEESLLAILARRYPDLVQPFLIGEDGLMGPFFEALLHGRAETTRIRESVKHHTHVAGLTDEDQQAASSGETRFFGLRMQQNRNAVFALDAFWRHLDASGIRVRRIIEIGTGTGGLSVLLQLYCLNTGAELVTYDVAARARDNAAFERLRIDQRIRDAEHEFVAAEIARSIQGEGVTLLVCDGGDTPRIASRFADYLKRGDYLLVHDYAPSTEVFDQDIRGRLWSWCEVTDADLRATSDLNGLREVLPEVFHPAVWSCRVKEGGHRAPAPRTNLSHGRVALYALSYNLPRQFELWLESVARADPQMFARTDRFLLNNSTDASTFAAYDALCEKYGFRQLRASNLGITGGRIWCAHHFEELGDHEAMLYFEDDMLLGVQDGLCSNGLTIRVEGLFEKSLEIIRNEKDLDFLKLSFTEFYGDHKINWAWVNLGEDGRRKYFANGRDTRIDAIKSYGGLGYVIGDIYYSNWPMIITRRGSQTLFPREVDLPRHEQGLMVRALELAREGRLRGGVLLASPIQHRRDHHYAAAERKEA